MSRYCYECYRLTDPEFLCDTCDSYYCDECSYQYSPHYQFEGARCYRCANQYPLYRGDSIKDKRDLKIERIINYSKYLEDPYAKVNPDD